MNKILIVLCGIFFISFANNSFAILRDPTRPPNAPNVENKSAFELTAIISSDDRKSAVINGKIVHVGDKIYDLQINSISSNEVILTGPAGLVSLKLVTSQRK